MVPAALHRPGSGSAHDHVTGVLGEPEEQTCVIGVPGPNALDQVGNACRTDKVGKAARGGNGNALIGGGARAGDRMRRVVGNENVFSRGQGCLAGVGIHSEGSFQHVDEFVVLVCRCKWVSVPVGKRPSIRPYPEPVWCSSVSTRRWVPKNQYGVP